MAARRIPGKKKKQADVRPARMSVPSGTNFPAFRHLGKLPKIFKNATKKQPQYGSNVHRTDPKSVELPVILQG